MSNPERIQNDRILLVAATVLLPAWAPILTAASPGSDPGLIGRIALSALCAAVFVGTYTSAWVRRHIELIIAALGTMVSLHVIAVASANHLDPVYFVSTLIVIFPITMTFESLRLCVAYAMVILVASYFVKDQSGGLQHSFFCTSIGTTTLVAFLSFYEKVRVLRRLREKNEKLQNAVSHSRAVIDAIPGMVSWVTSDLKYVGVNRIVAEAFEREVNSFVGEPVGFLDHASPMLHLLRDLFSSDAQILSRELTISGKDARVRHFLTTATKYRDGKEAVLVSIDISDRKRSEKELTKQKDLFSQVVENLPLGLIAKDAQNGYLFTIWNRRMEEITGVSRDELLGQTGKAVFAEAEAERLRADDDQVVRGRATLEVADELLTLKGKSFSAHTIKVPVIGPSGRPEILLELIEDITEKKARDALIRDQQTMLVHASKMTTLGEMSGGIAHEINNPLTIIQGFTNVLLKMAIRKDVDAVEMERICGKLKKTVERIAKIVQGLRSFSREASQDPYETVFLHKIVQETLELCLEKFRNHGVRVDIEGDLSLTLQCRPVQISQVLLNLLHNAFDAQEGQNDKWVRLRYVATDTGIDMIVTDSGRGIPEALVDKVLQPFFTTKGVGKGTGLGLSISKGIVEAHGGKLLYRLDGGHTAFVVQLPRVQSSTGEVPQVA